MIRETILSQNQRNWNDSDLKIKGRNLGYPDQLKQLTFAQRQALVEMMANSTEIEDKEAPMEGAFVQMDDDVTQNGPRGASNFES